MRAKLTLMVCNLFNQTNDAMMFLVPPLPLLLPSSRSSRRPRLTALPNPTLLIMLIRRNLTRPLRRLVHRRRRISRVISRRRRRVHVALHAVAVGVLLLAVVWGLRIVHWRAVRVVVVVARATALLYHPAVVGEGREVFAQAPAGVPVAEYEVEKEGEEEDGDDGVADGGAGLLRGDGCQLRSGKIGWIGLEGRLTWPHHQLQRFSS